MYMVKSVTKEGSVNIEEFSTHNSAVDYARRELNNNKDKFSHMSIWELNMLCLDETSDKQDAFIRHDTMFRRNDGSPFRQITDGR